MDLQIHRENDAQLFERRLREALKIAMDGQTALVIVPKDYPRQQVIGWLIHAIPAERGFVARTPGNELHFEGTRGSVRVYPADHITIRREGTQFRLLDYPAGIPTFVHPEVEAT